MGCVAHETHERRRTGILLHPTSLPHSIGNGDLGVDAYRFVDFLADSGCTLWQTLPLGPTHGDGSPYQCLSIHAGNELLISLRMLAEHGWLLPEELADDGSKSPAEFRRACLTRAYQGFKARASAEVRLAFEHFHQTHASWLDDYALYQAIRNEHRHSAWCDWPQPLRDREPQALQQARKALADRIGQIQFEQYLFFQQWMALKAYANQRGVLMFGDMPIFVAYDSADVWAQREYFRLDQSGRMEVVAGVPPDYFSATGQRWGNPHYRWDRMQADGFKWWLERLHTQLQMFDVVRIDHFRGFEAYWEIPAASETAINGYWVKAPGEALFETIRRELGALPLVAEDLGLITEEVHALRNAFALPGMKILQFAFDGGPGNPYLPHHHRERCVVYTGTHDNDTTCGWFASLNEGQRQYVREYLGHPQETMPWPLIRSALASVAQWAVLPLQDALELDSTHRMNTPGTQQGNWCWRFEWEKVPSGLAARLRQLNHLYGRC